MYLVSPASSELQSTYFKGRRPRASFSKRRSAIGLTPLLFTLFSPPLLHLLLNPLILFRPLSNYTTYISTQVDALIADYENRQLLIVLLGAKSVHLQK